MVVVVDRLDPAVSRLDRETTRDALCCEQFVPIWGERKICYYENQTKFVTNNSDIAQFPYKCFIEIRLLQLKINHLLHSKVVRPPGKRDSWLGSCCNRRTRNTQDGSWYPSPSGSSEKGKVSKGIREKLNNMFFDDGALLTNYDWWSWPSANRGKKKTRRIRVPAIGRIHLS